MQVTNNLSAAAKLTRLTASRAGAEGISLASALLGSVLITDVLLKHQVKDFKHYIAKRLVEPRLEKVEKLLDYVPSIETPKERAERPNLTRAERAERITDEFMDVFVIPAPLAFVGQMGGQKLFDKMMKVPDAPWSKHFAITAVDRAVQIGTMVVQNTALARVSVSMQSNLQHFLEKRLHMPEQRAEEWASYAVNVQIPNAVGMLAAIGMHYKYSKNENWHIGGQR